jgi:hypothetical protein
MKVMRGERPMEMKRREVEEGWWWKEEEEWWRWRE